MANKTGKGGFGDRPADINRGGRPHNSVSVRSQLQKFQSLPETDFYAFAYKHKMINTFPSYIDKDEALARASRLPDEITLAERNAMTFLLQSQNDTALALKLISETEGKPITWTGDVSANTVQEEEDNRLIGALQDLKSLQEARQKAKEVG